MAMQDSLRLHVTLTVVDGVFGGGLTWADLLALDPDTAISVSEVSHG
jgi:hypothetical protein